MSLFKHQPGKTALFPVNGDLMRYECEKCGSLYRRAADADRCCK